MDTIFTLVELKQMEQHRHDKQKQRQKTRALARKAGPETIPSGRNEALLAAGSTGGEEQRATTDGPLQSKDPTSFATMQLGTMQLTTSSQSMAVWGTGPLDMDALRALCEPTPGL